MGWPILAEVIGTCVRHDGRGAGMAAPNGLAQESLLKHALTNAGIEAPQVSFFETHGTGTKVGDQIEWEAVRAVYGQEPREAPLLMGAVKSVVGHLQEAAALAGIMKVNLAFRHHLWPALGHRQALLGACRDEQSKKGGLHLVQQQTPFPVRQAPSIAAISSFGLTGTIAQVILQSPPRAVQVGSPANGTAREEQVFTLSAKSAKGLLNSVQNWKNSTAVLSTVDGRVATMEDICYSLATGRDHFKHRVAVLASDVVQAVERVEAELRSADPKNGAPRASTLR